MMTDRKEIMKILIDRFPDCGNSYHQEVADQILSATSKEIPEPPTWYTKEQMYDYLINKDWEKNIATYFSEQYAENLQGAFNKGWRKGYNDLNPKKSTTEYVYSREEIPEGKDETAVLKLRNKLTPYYHCCPVVRRLIQSLLINY